MIETTIVIVNKLGMHARASSKLVSLANKFNANILLEKDAKSANAKSLMAVMMLVANKGSQIKIMADGTDEKDAISQLSELITNKFGEKE